MEKLAVVIPRPRIHLLLHHGAFAPRGRCHSGPVVVDDVPRPVPRTSPPPEAAATPAAYAPQEIASASQRRPILAARAVLSELAVAHGIPMAAVARYLGLSPQAVARGLKRAPAVFATHGISRDEMLGR